LNDFQKTHVYTSKGLTLGGVVRAVGAEAVAVEGGWRFYENASIEFDVRAEETGLKPIFLVARGTPALGVYPHLSLRVDRRPASGVLVATDEWGLYRMQVPLSAGRHRMDLAYDNDQFHYPADRNLDIRSLALGTPPPDATNYYRWRAPCRIPAERLAIRGYAECQDKGVSILNHGALGDDIYFEEAGWYSLQILMSQPRRGKIPSCLRVEMEGAVVTNFVLTSDSAATYLTQVKTEAGLARLTLVNDSPFVRRPPEADIRIEAISIGEPVLLPSPRPPRLALSAAPAGSFGASLACHSTGNALDGQTWALWSNGYMSEGVDCTEAGTWRISVTARGDLCQGKGPRLLVMVDKDQVASFRVNDTEFHEYAASATMSRGAHELVLVYDNDLSIPGEGDRNLYVQGVTLSSSDSEASDRPTR